MSSLWQPPPPPPSPPTCHVTAAAADVAAAADASPNVDDLPTAAPAGDRTVGGAAADVVTISAPAYAVGVPPAVSTPNSKAALRVTQGAASRPQALMIL